MRITGDDTVSTVHHRRVIQVEDGPVVDAGSSYKAGTLIRVEAVSVAWTDDETCG